VGGWGILGVKSCSGEVIVADLSGLFKTRTIQRKPYAERWSNTSASLVVGVPWRVNTEDPDVGGEPIEVIKLSVPEVVDAKKREQKTPYPTGSLFARKTSTSTAFKTRGPGCMAVLRGTF
jgi:hypothetical protein